MIELEPFEDGRRQRYRIKKIRIDKCEYIVCYSEISIDGLGGGFNVNYTIHAADCDNPEHKETHK